MDVEIVYVFDLIWSGICVNLNISLYNYGKNEEYSCGHYKKMVSDLNICLIEWKCLLLFFLVELESELTSKLNVC